MPSQIVSYKASVGIQRVGSRVQTRRQRVLELTCAPEFHGITMSAVLAFSTSFDSWSGTPAAGYLNVADPLRPRIVGWFPAGEFEVFYDLLRSEKPAYLTYDVLTVGGASYVSQISIGTATEPAGEGPADILP